LLWRTIEEAQAMSSKDEIEDNAIHVPNTESTATPLQISMVALVIIAILSIFLYGVNNQRVEVAQQGAPAPASSATTGQGGGAAQ
jgi:hypothetical protein